MDIEIRELSVDEMTIVSGGADKPIVIKMPGQVTIQFNPSEGLWAVFLGGKLYATEMGPA